MAWLRVFGWCPCHKFRSIALWLIGAFTSQLALISCCFELEDLWHSVCPLRLQCYWLSWSSKWELTCFQHWLRNFFTGLAWDWGLVQVHWAWVIFWPDWGFADCFIFHCSGCCDESGGVRSFFKTFCCGMRVWRAWGRWDWEEIWGKVNKFYKYFSKK